MAVMSQNYSENDFKQAVSSLLPTGEYWQFEQGDELDKLLSAVGRELKTTHDETKLNILYAEDNTRIGWRIADYQALLATLSVEGVVFDNPLNPNFIYIECNASNEVGLAMRQLESHRLPHTAFHWTTHDKSALLCAVSSNTLKIERSEMVLGIAPKRVEADIYYAVARHSTIINRRVLRGT